MSHAEFNRTLVTLSLHNLEEARLEGMSRPFFSYSHLPMF